MFAVVAHVGAGASRICQALADALDAMEHTPGHVDVSALINESAERHGLDDAAHVDSKDRSMRIRALQQAGKVRNQEEKP